MPDVFILLNQRPARPPKMALSLLLIVRRPAWTLFFWRLPTMSPCPNISRRSFLHTASSVAVGAVAARAVCAHVAADFRILEPMDGAVMHARLGRPVPGGLTIEVSGRAPRDAEVLVQDRPARRDGETFQGAAVLRERETEVVATAKSGSDRLKAKVRLVWNRHSRKRYRFVIDDNSFFLRDITRKQYQSLFDCFYLKMLKDLNDTYGARFTLNIYYTTGDDWNLTRFPDKYRGEWEANADWLRLAFHAYANDPPRPYQDAPVEKLLADLDLVNAQIRRFAGPETFSPVVVVHWGMTRPAAWKELHDRGSRVLGGYFRKSADGKWDINYRMDDARSEWLSRHDLLKDFESGMIFSKVDMVVNSTPLEEIVPKLKPLVSDPCQGEVIDFLTHEQYFWPFYRRYLPDHAERMERAIAFVTEHGYKPVFLQDGFLGNTAVHS